MTDPHDDEIDGRWTTQERINRPSIFSFFQASSTEKIPLPLAWRGWREMDGYVSQAVDKFLNSFRLAVDNVHVSSTSSRFVYKKMMTMKR